jgi:thiol-disulfide isomerase/thioredoxin
MVTYIDLQDASSLNSADFKTFVNKVLGKLSFVMVVTAEWCGHCKNFVPVIMKSIKESKSTNLHIVHVSDVVANHLMQHDKHLVAKILKETVSGFPTAFACSKINNKNGMHIVHFSEDRTVPNFKKFVNKAASIKTTPVKKTVPMKKVKSPK